MSWLRLYAAMASVVTLVSAPPLVLLSLDRRIEADFFLPVLLAGLLFELAFAVLLAAGNPVDVSADGVRGFNFYGVRSAMTWEEITSATPSRYFGLPWLIVRSHRTKNTLWLPLFFTDNRGFADAVAHFAPPGRSLLFPVAR